MQEAWGGKRQPERRHNKGGGNLPLEEASHGGDGGLGSAAGDLLDKVSRETSCRSAWTSVVKLRMEVWFASQTATKLEITERRERTSPEGGMGGGGGGTGKVLGP